MKLLKQLCFLFIVIHGSLAYAGDWQVTHTFVGDGGQQYGEATAISEDGKTVAVSAALAPQLSAGYANQCGAVFVYVKVDADWQQQARLEPADPCVNSGFGGYDFYDRTIALDASGDHLLIATFGGTPGAVYVFERNQGVWHQQQKLALFGGPRSVAISGNGDAMAVSTSRGKAYVFARQGDQWLQQADLVGSSIGPSLGSDSRRFSVFGSSVDISGDGTTVIVGSSGYPSDLDQAYIFKKVGNQWLEQALLSPLDKNVDKYTAIFDGERDGFGFSVALSKNGNIAIVGSGSVNGGMGSVYVFARQLGGQWQEEAKLGANLSLIGSVYGFSLDIDGTGSSVVVGDWGTGKSFLFTRHESPLGEKVKWKPQLLTIGSTLGGGLGSSVAISNSADYILTSQIGSNQPPNCAVPTPTGRCGNVFLLERQR